MLMLSQAIPLGFSVLRHLRHPSHPLLEGANKRNVIITQRFHAAPVQATRDFFRHTDGIFQLQVLSLINARAGAY